MSDATHKTETRHRPYDAIRSARPLRPRSPMAPEAVRPPVKEILVEDLLDLEGRLVIRHGPERYLLRLTRQNKLLLTK